MTERKAHTPNTGLAKVAVQYSANTFVVTIANFSKPETVIGNVWTTLQQLTDMKIHRDIKTTHFDRGPRTYRPYCHGTASNPSFKQPDVFYLFPTKYKNMTTNNRISND